MNFYKRREAIKAIKDIANREADYDLSNFCRLVCYLIRRGHVEWCSELTISNKDTEAKKRVIKIVNEWARRIQNRRKGK